MSNRENQGAEDDSAINQPTGGTETEHEEPLYHVRRAIYLAEGDEEKILRDAHNKIVQSREAVSE